MMAVMKNRLLALLPGLLVAVATFALPLIALAKEDEETQQLEARLEGYANNVRLPHASTALTWLLISFLAVCAVAALFKNAKRTHLD